MVIDDLSPEQEALYRMCLEDWSDEMKEAGDHKCRWLSDMKDKGLRVKLARDDNGTIGGMIQYLPIEHSFAEGEDLYLIYCIWVHGHKQGRGNFQHRGMGKALLCAAEEDAKALGAKGMAAWGLVLPFWMKASWFRRQGYRSADRVGAQALVWKPFTTDAKAPSWIRRKKKPVPDPDKVTVSAFVNGWCPAQNIVFERAKRASETFGSQVVFRAYDTSDSAVFQEWGIADGLYIDGKEVWTGPPPSYETIKGMIAKAARARGI